MSHQTTRLCRAVLLTAALGLSCLLTVGSSKRADVPGPEPQRPPPPTHPPPGPPPVEVTPPAATVPGYSPPEEKAITRPVPRSLRPPRLPTIYGRLPGGVSHGYFWILREAGRCASRIPATPFRECSINRGRLIGCGHRVGRNKMLPLCVRGLHRRCSTDHTGRVRSCPGLFSGWSTSYHRGLYRVCCFRGGRLVTCTNSSTYICTDKDSRRLAAIRRRDAERRRMAVRRRYVTRRRTASPGRRGAYYNCDIFNGRVGHCRGWYHGHAVVYHRGSYQRCRIFNGQVSHCGGWYKGTAPVLKGSVWYICDIFNGQAGHCRGWYRGRAAVYK